MKTSRLFTFTTVVAALASTGLAHDEILAVGDGKGSIRVHADYVAPIYLDQNLPGFAGIGGFPLGITTAFVDEPAEGIYVLPETSNMVFVLTYTDAGLTMFKDGGVPLEVGEGYQLGTPYFHVHPVWTVVNPTLGQSYQLRGYFRDTTGAMADSEEFSIDFVALFAPGCVGDTNGDLAVTFGDITTILANFGSSYAVGSSGAGDANNNGVVNFGDVTTALANFGNACN